MITADGIHEHERWKGSFISSIVKIQRERGICLSLSQDALQYLDRLLIRLLVSLLNPVPKNVQDEVLSLYMETFPHLKFIHSCFNQNFFQEFVGSAKLKDRSRKGDSLLAVFAMCFSCDLAEAQDQILRKFPEPLSSGALEDSKVKIREKGKKKIHISVDKVHHIVKDCSPSNADKQVSHFLAAILEYMLSDVLKLTVNYVQNISRMEIKEQDVKIAMFADKVLVNIFQGDEAEEDVPLLPITSSDENGEASYSTLVRNLLIEEQRYLKDLLLIIKFFKKAFTDLPNLFTESDIDLIFNNIEDLAEMSMKLIVMLEEASEMSDESNPGPLVGYCFEELAEECSFDLYSDYTINFTKPQWDKQFHAILQQSSVNFALKEVKAEGFRDMVAYVLPNLLVAPIYHCIHYFDQIHILEHSTADNEDQESFNQTISAISPIKLIIESKANGLPKKRPSEASLRISWKGGVQAGKMKEVEESIEGWVGKTITQTCNEFIYEGDLLRINGKRVSERRAFLLDSLLICCKSNQGRRPMPSVTMTHEFRLKERILLRKTTVVDDEQNDCQFKVIEGDTERVFQTHSVVEKRAWMGHLVRLQYRSTYDRMLDQLMRKEAQQQPLRIPSPDVYRFAEPDSPKNLVTDQEKPVPSIKGGTVIKLVERLTYHKYYDSGFTKTFLTTYRSFCKPSLLLDLLIERFDIPEPPPSEQQKEAINRGEIITRDDLKRFRNEYLQPIQLRVMNVLRQWLEYHWYDFETDDSMLERVEQFVASVRGKNMQKWARTMIKIIAKKKDCEEETPIPSFEQDPPTVEWHLTHDRAKFSIMTLHPIEIARQLTLLEFDLYRKVQPSELVGTVWTKAGKEENSPNLLKMIHCSTTITRWVSRSIVETKNFEERTAVMSRAVEIMQVLKQLNNFNGLLEFVAAFNSSAIHRLNHTKQHLPDRLVKALSECMDLCDPRLTRCLEKLRSCDPPCVPFVGTFLTNILKTEEGNPHLLPNYPEELKLINFAKRRMVASILFDIQQYQNMPYNLLPVPEVREYLTNLKPLKGYTEKQLSDHLFQSSLEVEPRQAEKPARFPRTVTDKEMKSPGIIPSKKSTKSNLFRDESRISLLDRHNSIPDEDSVAPPERTPETPVTPLKEEPAPPPCPPRLPRYDVSCASFNGQSMFTFDLPAGPSSYSGSPFFQMPSSVEEEDAPPPLPPRDDIPYPMYYPDAEPEFFHNEDMIAFHQPVIGRYGQPEQYAGEFVLPDLQDDVDSVSCHQLDFYSQPDPQFVGYPAPFSQVPPLVSRAPPVPPRDAPVIPPRDPPSSSNQSFDSYSGIRYVPDPTRFPHPTRYSSPADVPPPVPRRQPSAPSI